MSAVLFYAGDPCSQLALQLVRGNPEIGSSTQFVDARTTTVPPEITLVPTLRMTTAGGIKQYTGKQVLAVARSIGGRATAADRAIITCTDLQYTIRDEQSQARPELGTPLKR